MLKYCPRIVNRYNGAVDYDLSAQVSMVLTCYIVLLGHIPLRHDDEVIFENIWASLQRRFLIKITSSH